ncbi:MAG: AIPR family protein [Gammaproteobacteria bacterium]|nr:AIPR family protein [Gammaproteobacteria bacterium]
MSTALEEPLDECVELLTEGGNDAGVDGLHMGDVEEGEFHVTIFQGKYRVKDLDAQSNFPANSVQKTLDTVRVLFDPLRAVALNEKIAPVIQEVRSLIRDGYVPTVRVALCNNGARWVADAQTRIDEAERDYGEQLQVIHFNHDAVVRALKRGEQIDDTMALTGRALVEDMNYMRVLVGRVAVHEVARLFDEHGDQLLQRNIRRHLGHANRVNREIKQTLLDDSKSDKFYFYNNGVTMVCDRFVYNALQQSDYRVQAKNLQVVNGGQTCKTIQQTLHDNPCFGAESAFVMIRLYELPEGAEDVVREITKATNSQTPVDLRDLRSNDEIQLALALGMDELGYTYKRQREEAPNGGDRTRVVTSMAVAEAVLAVWRERPHQAKFRRRELFGKLYDLVFEGLNAAQAILATLIYKGVEDRRKTEFDDEPDFLPYASLHLAMLIGRELLGDAGLAVADVSHRNFTELTASLTEDGDRYYALALDALETALVACYGDREVSLQQLAATFRRGDLLEMLSPETPAS